MVVSTMKNYSIFIGVFLIILFKQIFANRNDMLEDEVKIAPFDVKPGGMIQSHSETLDGVTCTFTYACQGGTNEKWDFGLSHNKEKSKYSCVIERSGHGGKSYLFFQEFKVEISGAKMQEVEVYSEQGVHLKPEEFFIDTKSKVVSQVNGEFQSQLSKIDIHATRSKEEL